jgi:hypothetical protein
MISSETCDGDGNGFYYGSGGRDDEQVAGWWHGDGASEPQQWQQHGDEKGDDVGDCVEQGGAVGDTVEEDKGDGRTYIYDCDSEGVPCVDGVPIWSEEYVEEE